MGDTGESQEGLETPLKGSDLGLWDGLQIPTKQYVPEDTPECSQP